MAKLFLLRIYPRLAGAVSLVALTVLVVSLEPFLGAAPLSGSTGIGLQRTPPVSVNRFSKGDRQPLFVPGSAKNPVWQELPTPDGLQTREKTPLGCDPAFSPVSSPSHTGVYGRCIV